MPYYKLPTLLLTTTCCLAGHLSMAQRQSAVAPIAPRNPVVLPQENLIEVPIGAGMQPARPATAPAHEASQPVVIRKWPRPLFILNSSLIIGDLDIKPMAIEKIMVYKGKDAPQQWHNLVTHGIIDITTKSKVKTKSWSFKQISRRIGVTGPVSYSVNGLPVAGANLRIATNAIGEIKITRATPTAPNTLVDIVIILPKRVPHPPGTIMIRGTAAL